jgi:hypothetical protein
MASRSKKIEYDLTINGRAVQRGEFLAEISRFVRERVQVRPRELAEAFGPEWVADAARKQYISQTMGNMATQGWLIRLKHGLYSLHPNFDTRKTRRLEDSVIDTIRSLGGLARARDILDDFGARPAANKGHGSHGGRGGTAAKIFKAMRDSHRIVHYDLPKRPRWGLTWGDMQQEPMTGTVAAYFLELGFLEAIENGTMEGGKRWLTALQDEIKEHYNMVGLAFRRVRQLFNVEARDLLTDEPFFDALEQMKQSSTALTTRIFADIKDDTERRAAEEGRPDDTYYIEQLRDAETEVFHAHILTYFEMGDPAAHQNAPPAFYKAFAEHFGMDAASLSRGCVLPTPKDTHLTEEWWRGEGAIAEFGEPIYSVPHNGRRHDDGGAGGDGPNE